MKIILIIIGYLLPAIIATLIVSFIEKNNVKKQVIEIFQNFDKKNSGPIYNFLKSIISCLFLLFGILIFLFSVSIALLGGLEFSNYLISSSYINSIIWIILNIIADCILFSFSE